VAWLEARGEPLVSKRELHRALVKRGSAAEADVVIDRLIKLDAIRSVSGAIPGKGRPSSPLYEVSPYLRGSAPDARDPEWEAFVAAGEPEISDWQPDAGGLAVSSSANTKGNGAHP
jgi:hypothetical protein